MSGVSALVAAVSPATFATAIEGAKPRIRKKAESLVAEHDSWEFGSAEVRIGTATVGVDGSGALVCDCLLSPKCAHVLAVALAVQESRSQDDQGPPSAPEPSTGQIFPGGNRSSGTSSRSIGQDPAHLTEAQRAALDAAEDALDLVLRRGIAGLTSTDVAGILRVVHICRVVGLVRLGATLTALHTVVRDRRTEGHHPVVTRSGLGNTGSGHSGVAARGYRAGPATAGTTGAGAAGAGGSGPGGTGTSGAGETREKPPLHVVEVVRATCLAVLALRRADAVGAVGTAELGEARRTYRPVGSLWVRGVACEPVVTDAGYAGVVTWFVGADGGTYRLSSVLPGEVESVARAYRAGARLADLGLAPRDLARGAVLLTGATVSEDGTLGRPKDLRAMVVAPDPVGAGSVGTGSVGAGSVGTATAGGGAPGLPAGWTRVTGRIASDARGLRVGAERYRWTPAARRLGVGEVPGGHDAEVAGGPDAEVEGGHDAEVAVLVRGREVMAVEYTDPGNDGGDTETRLWFPGLDRYTPPNDENTADGSGRSGRVEGRADGRGIGRTAGAGVMDRARLAADAFPESRRGPRAVLGTWVRAIVEHGSGVLQRDHRTLEADVVWLRAHGSPHRAGLLEESGASAAGGGDTAGAGEAGLIRAWTKAAVALGDL
ncbi:hypothetical protein [Brevibacterium litoralis]|uniref:hypothetical protein n=1 Tax=Brevibacterium litoralis TaxID=3138935 RepID=UPI0032ECBF31